MPDAPAPDRQDVVLGLYAMDHLTTEKRVLALAERPRPWRSLAAACLFQAALEGSRAR